MRTRDIIENDLQHFKIYFDFFRAQVRDLKYTYKMVQDNQSWLHWL